MLLVVMASVVYRDVKAQYEIVFVDSQAWRGAILLSSDNRSALCLEHGVSHVYSVARSQQVFSLLSFLDHRP